MVRHGIQQGPPIAARPRLALVTSSYPANSADYAGAFIPGFAAALARRGCEVTVLTPDKPAEKEECETHDVRWFKWAGASKALVDFKLSSPADLMSIGSLLRSGTKALRDLIEQEQIDHCLALWAVPAGYIAQRACGRSVPYSVWALGSDIHTWARRPFVGRIVRNVLRGAAHRFADGLALSEDVKRISGLHCDFMPSTRSLPTPGSIPPAPAGATRFLFVGRLEPVKGADVVVEAMVKLVAGGVDAYLNVCGEGSLGERLRRRAASSRASGRINFLGSQPAEAVAAYMRASQCLVIPSRMESIPIVFSEALHAGVPMLVTDVGDMGRLARRGGMHAPVPAGDVDALATGMQDFVRHEAEERERYRAARDELLPVFDLHSIVERLFSAITAAQ